MTDSFLDKYGGRRLDELAASPQPTEPVDDLGCMGYLRGVRERAVMLELRKRDGHVLAIGYGWLERVEFEPSTGITLAAGGRNIRIKGRHLNGEVRPGVRLFEAITRHRVSWVKEAGRAEELRADGKASLIERIEW